MIKDKKIFDGCTMTLNGDKVRVLTTPYHITHTEIPDELNVYSLIKKGDHFMVDDMDTTNTDDYAMSMISHIAVPLGSNIEIENCDILYGPSANMSIQEYHTETVGIIKLYVMMPTDGITFDEIVKRLGAARRCFAIACGRNVDDVEVLNIVNDPCGINANFETETERSIYRLTKNIKIMATATHVLDMSRVNGIILRNPCSVEREVCEKYDLNRIEVALIDGAVRKMRKQNDDLNIIMGRTNVVGAPSRPRFGNTPIPYRTPGLGGEYGGDMMPMYTPPLGFPL